MPDTLPQGALSDGTPIAAEQHLRLVHACCRRFRDKGIEYDDLFQAGCMGLVKAAQGFDAARGYQFSTYAVPVVMGEIKRLFRENGAVKVSRALKERCLQVANVREQLCRKLSREPKLSELAEACALTPEETAEALEAGRPVLSLTAAQSEGEEGDATQTDVPVSFGEEELLEIMALRRVIGELESTDRRLIFLRYFGNRTQSDTAQQLGMPQVQVSRRERKILDELRKKMA